MVHICPYTYQSAKVIELAPRADFWNDNLIRYAFLKLCLAIYAGM